MRKCTPLAVLAGGLVAMLGVGRAFADDFTIPVHLSNASENPPTNPTSSGGGSRPASFGDFTFQIHTDPNPANQFVIMDGTVTNIDVTGSQTPNEANDNLANAHIHANASVLPNTNTGVVWGFFGSPQNDTTPDDRVFTPFATGVGGTFHGKWDPSEGNGTTLAAQINNLLTFHAYINFHTSQFGGGEIRGMIPEPSCGVLLLGTGLVGLTGARRRRS